MAKHDIIRQPADALSVAQQNAVDCLAAGMTDAETAAAVGTSHQTVCNWRLHNPTFGAALNARRLEVWGAAGDKLRSLVPRAVAAFEGALLVFDPTPHNGIAALLVLGLVDHKWAAPGWRSAWIMPAVPLPVSLARRSLGRSVVLLKLSGREGCRAGSWLRSDDAPPRPVASRLR